MKVVVAIDSLKGSLSSLEAGQAIETGIKSVIPTCSVVVRPLADGGEGTVDALVNGMGGIMRSIQVSGPLDQSVKATYGILPHNKTAIIEMSSASGITLVSGNRRNPLYTSTYGVGEMIKDAILQGCRRFIVGIGGSATNDGGIGMLSALGYEFLDSQHQPVSKGAIGLKDLAVIKTKHVIKELVECEFQIACDVENPLCGELGCSAIYGPQKGATPEMIKDMDGWLKNYAKLVKQHFPHADDTMPGTGAAGGLGFAFLSFMRSVLEPGIDIVLKETNLKNDIQDCDWVVTGEGRIDGQTAMGKAPVGVAKLAKKYHKPVIAFAGSVSQDASLCNDSGIDAFFPILREITTLDRAMDKETAKDNLMNTVKQVFRLINIEGEK